MDRIPDWLDRSLFPFSVRQFQSPDGAMAFVDAGPRDATAIVFVHGTPTFSLEWRAAISAFSSGFRCLAIDHLGFGLSDKISDPDALTPERHAERFSLWLSALGLERFALVVHDFGGPIALPDVLARPERVLALALINTWMWPLSDTAPKAALSAAKFFATGAGRFLYEKLALSPRLLLPMSYGDRSRLTRDVHAQYLAAFAEPNSRVATWALARSLTQSEPFFADLWTRRDALRSIPTGLFWGEKDPTFAAPFLARWRRTLPDAPVVTFPSAGHWPHEEEPQAFVEALGAFLLAQGIRAKGE